MRLEDTRDTKEENPAISWNIFDRTSQEEFNAAGVGFQRNLNGPVDHLLPKCEIDDSSPPPHGGVQPLPPGAEDDTHRLPIERPSPQRPYPFPSNVHHNPPSGHPLEGPHTAGGGAKTPGNPG